MSITSTGSSTSGLSMEAIWTWIGESELAFQIGATWWFPLLESIHVVAICLLVGAICMADLRLLGWMGKRYDLHQFVDELTPWAWGAFVPAVVTGLGLFISRPAAYAANPAFQVKFVLLLLAGANVFYFHRYVYAIPAEGIAAEGITAKGKERLAAGFSIVLWAGVILAGRWVGHIN